MNGSDLLPSWTEGAAKTAVLEFAESVSRPGASYVTPADRIAVFDNDGTLWCEKPMPIQFDFILRRLSEIAQADPGLRGRQPWKAAYERHYGWFGTVITEHYAGNDADVGTLLDGIRAAYEGISVEEFEAKSGAFLRTTQHPTLGRGYLQCVYAPMVELLGYLEANGFTNYIVSGGGRDFMRPVSHEVYGIPRDQVIGSTAAFQYTSDDRGGTITHKAEADVLDDGPQKPIRIWSHAGQRPLLAAGNSNGDIPMLDFTCHPGRPTLRLLLLHDDGQREFAYTSGAEQALERAGKDGWTVVSMHNDFKVVFDP
jgi:phosphoserine phosphatase